MHKCIEVYAKGEVPREMLPDVFEALWGEYIQNDLYKDGEVNYAKEEEYYEQGLKYLREQILDLSSYEILGVEKEINFQLTDEEGSYPMIGYIDLLLKDKETGEITIMDNKSASIKFKKNGDPYKADEQHWLEFKRQLYLYSVPFVENGEEISYLSWNLFRLGIVKTIPWNADEYNAAKKWAIDTIREIKREEEWGYKEDFFYCHNLCSLRGECAMNISQRQKGEFDSYYDY